MEPKTPPAIDPQTLASWLGVGSVIIAVLKRLKRLIKSESSGPPLVRGLEEAVKLAYDVGAIEVFSVIGIDSGEISGLFGRGVGKVAIPAGDYLLIALPKPSKRKRGITPHPNPNAKAE